MRGLMCVILLCASLTAGAKEGFPERQTLRAGNVSIEYSVGDEAYAKALVAQLPMQPADTPRLAKLPLTTADLAARRTQALALVGEWLALPPTTPKLGQVYDAFIRSYTVIAAMPALPSPTHFALWRSEEIQGRLAAGQDIAGFRHAPDGGLEFSMNATFEFTEGEAPELGLKRLRENWERLVWPIKIGADAGATPAAEIRERLAGMAGNIAQLSAFQSEELQKLAVQNVLHETVEATLVETTIRSADRRWFCEGVANYVAFKVIEAMTSTDVAKQYYDLEAAVAKANAVRDRVDLEHWPVVEDARAKDVPADVNLASYTVATERVFKAFEGKQANTLPDVLREVRRAKPTGADIATVRVAYRKTTGQALLP